jgi:hypothetical protein
MAKVEQLNTSVAADIYTRFSTIAAERKLSNAALLRDLVEELIEAADAGRALFQKEAAPRLDATVSGLVHQLRELVMELDRAQSDNARMLGKLTEKWNGGEEANRIAQEKLLAHFRAQDQASLSPFYARAEQLLAAFEALEPKLLAALEPHLAKISEQLDKSIALASEPRQMRSIYLGDNRFLSLKFLSACGGLALLMGALVATILPTQFDGWSVWQSGKLIDHPAKMCRLIARKYGTTNCRVPEQERDLGLRVIAHEDRR